MPLEKKQALERLEGILGDIRMSKTVNKKSVADYEDAQDAVTRAQNKENIKPTAETAKEAMDESHAREVEAIRNLAEHVRDMGGREEVLERRIAELEQQVKEEQRAHASFSYNEAGNLRTWSKEAATKLSLSDTKNEQIREWQTAGDDVLLINEFVKYGRRSGNRVVKGVNKISDTKAYKKYEQMTRALYSTGSTAGDELVPTVFSSQVHELFQMERKLMNLFNVIQMPSNPWHIPTTTANQTIYKLSEKTVDDAANIKASSPATSSATLTAVKLGSRTTWSGELEEDSIAAVSQMVQTGFVRAYAAAVENAMISGQLSAAIDTGLTILADDELNAWDGLRKLANSNSATVDISSTTDAKILSLCALLGEYGGNLSDLVLVPSVEAYLMYMVGSSAFSTWDAVGPNGTPSNSSGSVGVFYGIPVAPSSKVRQDLNASGIYDGSTTTKTAIVVANRTQWVMGERRGFTTKVQEDILTDQLHMVTTGRHIFKKLAASTDLTEAYGYNI